MAKMNKVKRVLFFVNGPLPSEEERAEANALSGQGYIVSFRNAAQVSPSEALEAFDKVAGEVPANYAAAARAKSNEPKLTFEPEFEPAPVAPASKAAVKAAAKQAEKDAAARAKEALTGGAQPQAPSPAPQAPAPAPEPAPASGDLTGGWATQPAATPPPGAAPGWQPNA